MIEETAYLHDATLTGIHYHIGAAGTRYVMLAMIYHPDAGHPSLNGRALSVRAEDVVFMSWTAYGYTVGRETVDEWKDRVSEDTARGFDELRKAGVLVPERQVRVEFRSGSVLELVCERLEINIGESSPEEAHGSSHEHPYDPVDGGREN